MDKPTVLLQLDTDDRPSVFDRIVAIDAGAQQVLSYGGIEPEMVRDLVHGCIFTRGPKDLKRTAVFIGGSNVESGEQVREAAQQAMLPEFGLQVSILLDSSGANTTAAAAVRAAGQHLELNSAQALILGGTGPVGQRVARLLAGQRSHVRVGSRQIERAEGVCAAIREQVPGAKVEAVATASSKDGPTAFEGRNLVIAAGAAGVVLLPKKLRAGSSTLKVMIDLNAVPPAGIEGIEPTDDGVVRDGVLAFGALGVGGLKMKIHKAAIARLFERNDLVLDAEDVFALAQSL
jgi:methylenetetrahydrofolate/methylenetetrahydromethanopterin dehydrogenase (NADP+)